MNFSAKLGRRAARRRFRSHGWRWTVLGTFVLAAQDAGAKEAVFVAAPPIDAFQGLGESAASLGRMVVILGVVLLGALAALRFIRVRTGANVRTAETAIQIVGTRRLDAKRSMHLVRADGADVLVLVSDHAASMIALPPRASGDSKPPRADSCPIAFSTILQDPSAVPASEGDRSCP